MPLVPSSTLFEVLKKGCGEKADLDLFPIEILDSVAVDVPDGFKLRPLRLSDYHHGYLQLLAQLTTVGEVSEETYKERFLSMAGTQPNAYFVVVVEDIAQVLVGAATLVLEWKFIHGASLRGRVEDVVVDEGARGRGLARVLNQTLVALARERGAYKLSLECKDALIPFYAKFGYKPDQNFLVIRFD